jgi:hypothetical protein
MSDIQRIAVAVIAQAARDVLGADRPHRPMYVATLVQRLRPRVDAARFLAMPTPEQRDWFRVAGVAGAPASLVGQARELIRRYAALVAWDAAHPGARVTEISDETIEHVGDLLAA